MVFVVTCTCALKLLFGKQICFKEHFFLKEILYQFFLADFRKENANLICETKDANWMDPCGYAFNT